MGRLYKTDVLLKDNLKESFPYKRPLLHKHKLDTSYQVRCLVTYNDIKFAEHLIENLPLSRQFPKKKQMYRDKILEHLCRSMLRRKG